MLAGNAHTVSAFSANAEPFAHIWGLGAGGEVPDGGVEEVSFSLLLMIQVTKYGRG